MRRTASSPEYRVVAAARLPGRTLALGVALMLAVTGVFANVLFARQPAWALPFAFFAVPPEGTVFLPDENGVINQPFSGEGTAGATVQIRSSDFYDFSSEILCTATVAADETWSCAVTTMPDTFGTFIASSGPDSVGLEYHALNPPTLTNADLPGNGYETRLPASFSFEGTTYQDGGGLTTVTATVTGVGSCLLAPVVAGQFNCPIDLSTAADGTYNFTITTTTSFATSATRTGSVRIDTTGPSFTSIISPTDGAVVANLTPTVTGTGEPNGTAFPLYFPSFAPACPPTPINGAGVWSCTLSTLAPGSYTIGSYQEDAIGNTGPSPDPQVTFTVVAPPPPPPAPSAPGPNPPAAGFFAAIAPGVALSQQPPTTPRPTPTATPEPISDSSDEPTAAAATPSDGAAPVVGGGGADDPTVFGTSLRTPFEVFSTPAVVVGGAIAGAAAFLLFVAIPAELLHATVRDNYHRLPAWGGSWRTRLNAWSERVQHRIGRTASLVGAVALVAALSTLVDPNAGFTAATFRLGLAIAVSLLVVNLLGGLLLRSAAKRWFDVDVVQRILPGAILLTAATVLLSRLFGVAPGLLFGLVLGIQLARELRQDQSGRLAAFVITVLLGFGIGAWLLYGVSVGLGSTEPSFAELLWRETLVAITVESLSSLVIAMIPIMFMDGRDIWRWSKVVWAGLAALSVVVFVIIILPLPSSWAETSGPLAQTVVLFIGFMALTAVIWAVFRSITAREERATATAERNSTSQPN